MEAIVDVKVFDRNRGGVDLVVDGLWGSCGKGKVAGFLAAEEKYDLSIVVASPNCGHTVYAPGSQEKVVLQQVPVAAAVSRTRCILSAGSLIDPELFLAEVALLGLSPKNVGIDAAAGVVEERHIKTEADKDLHKRLGSTAHGVGAARAERLIRDPQFKLAKDIESLKPFITDCSNEVNEVVSRGGAVLLEGGQGTLLSHNVSGPDGQPFYPYITSCVRTASGLMADSLVAPRDVRNVISVFRSYPIRVAGNSGPFYAPELNWEDITRLSGSTDRIEEITTVTKKVRRVASLSDDIIKLTNRLNKPDAIALMFADYYDTKAFGKSRWEEMPEAVISNVRHIEQVGNVPVWLLGTGPKHEQMVRRF
jgi:adenylosuccinate synthase